MELLYWSDGRLEFRKEGVNVNEILSREVVEVNGPEADMEGSENYWDMTIKGQEEKEKIYMYSDGKVTTIVRDLEKEVDLNKPRRKVVKIGEEK